MAATPWAPQTGHTLLIPSGPGPDQKHLFVIIYGPAGLPSYGPIEQLVLVGMSSVKAGLPYDTACEIQAGEHPFAVKPSYMAYRHARIERVDHATQMVESGTWGPKEPVSAYLLDRIVAGVWHSKLISREIRKILFP